MEHDRSLGATPLANGQTRFRVWAPRATTVSLQIVDSPLTLCPMKRLSRGYFEVTVDNAPANTQYWYQLDSDRLRPDPASRSQPGGVHGPSAVVDPSTFEWSSLFWQAPPIERYVIYELHVGTFTLEGTFNSALAELDRLSQLGITAVELMPINEFPGARDWGYDGAYPFAAAASYGGAAALARFVDACHQRKLAVILDVVYNHFGPEGSYVGEFGSYYSDRYKTLWGNAINFDGPDSDEVRRYFIQSALYWLRDLRVDAFRVDAIHAICDQSAEPFLRQLTATIHDAARSLGRTAYVIAESDLNDPRVIRSAAQGGLGFDAQWSDDLHHALHTALTAERSGIYADFGGVSDVKRAYERGFVYTGQYSRVRSRAHGAAPDGISPTQLIVCSQNHDQIGNRPTGDRLSATLSLAKLKLAAASSILSPFIPMLFMGEEYGETAPFQYFTDFSDLNLCEAVRRGRAEEFAAAQWPGEIPDPQAIETFTRSKLNPKHRCTSYGGALHDYYHELLRLRKDVRALAQPMFACLDVNLSGSDQSVVVTHRKHDDCEAVVLLNFANDSAEITLSTWSEDWLLLLDSTDERWGGESVARAEVGRLVSTSVVLAPWSAMLLSRSEGEVTGTTR